MNAQESKAALRVRIATMTVGALMFGPFLAGGVYGIVAVPLFSAVCGPSSKLTGFVNEPIRYADYQTFLSGGGCEFSTPSSSDADDEPGMRTDQYIGPSDRGEGDVVSAIFAKIGHFLKSAFFEGVGVTALPFTVTLAKYAIFRGFLYIVYLFVVTVGAIILKKAVEDLLARAKKKDAAAKG